MEILSLTDNLCALPGCKAQHGISLYIKTKKHKISRLAESLDRFRVHYYTCHCTGELAFLEMKERLKGNLDYLAVGGCVQINDNGSILKNPKEFSQKDLTKMSNRHTILRTNEREFYATERKPYEDCNNRVRKGKSIGIA